jgi:molecular chaperone HscB
MQSAGSLKQPLSLAATDFELFELPAQFEFNRNQLDAQWKALQQQVHPDQFASQGPADKRLAMQWSVRVNEAYQRLKNPLRRAAYLCELHGAPLQAEDNTSMPAAFLMQQMQWREDLDEAHTVAALTSLQADINDAKQQALQRCAQSLDVDKDWLAAVQEVRALMFIERFEEDLNNRLDRLEDA